MNVNETPAPSGSRTPRAGDAVRFRDGIGSQFRHARLAEVLWSGEAEVPLVEGSWGTRTELAIYRTDRGAYLVRRFEDQLFLSRRVIWHVADSPEKAAALLDPDSGLDLAALKALGWLALGAQET